MLKLHQTAPPLAICAIGSQSLRGVWPLRLRIGGKKEVEQCSLRHRGLGHWAVQSHIENGAYETMQQGKIQRLGLGLGPGSGASRRLAGCHPKRSFSTPSQATSGKAQRSACGPVTGKRRRMLDSTRVQH